MKCPKCAFENPADIIFCGRCGSRLDSVITDPSATQTYIPPVSTLKVGSVLNQRYQIIDELGRGGMGRVYKAMDLEIDEKIAIKVLNPEIYGDKRIIERFRNELKIARKIRHKNVCQMFDLERGEGIYFITMEYVSGDDLKTTIQRLGRISEGKILIIAKQICKGLGEAHARGVVHRDLKPHNIMIDRAGDVRLMDFGIARTQVTEGLTETGAMIGTPEYMSPEQAMGEKIDKRSDIYSFGIILFELATGRTPFKGDTAVSVAMKHKTEIPPEPREFNEHISPKLNDLILKCLEKDREKRFQSVDEILSEIGDIEEGRPSTDKLVPYKPSSVEILRKRLPVFSVLGILVLVILAVITVRLLLPRKERPAAVPEFVLSISSDPEGASVYLGDQFLGLTPLDRPVKSGSHALKLVKEGYQTTEENIEITANANRTFTLYELEEAVKTGVLEVKSAPEKAEVSINEEKKGMTPLRMELEAGTYSLSIAHPGFQITREEILIKAGGHTAKLYILDRKPAAKYALRVTSEPSEAGIYIDGTYVGTTPRNLELSQGTGGMRLQKDGWLAKDLRLNLKAGTNPPKHVLLQPVTFNLSVNSTPPGAKVYWDDQDLGFTPLTGKYPTGTYKLRIVMEGYCTEEASIVLNQDREELFELIPAVKVNLQIKVMPKADVFMDGKMQGEVPPYLTLEVIPGTHIFEFREKDSGKKYAAKLLVEPAEGWELRMYMEDGRLIQRNLDTGEQKVTRLKISN